MFGAELGMSSESAGIMILNRKLYPGDILQRQLGLNDIVLELEITPNRPDCLSIIGIAREISAFTKNCILIPEYDYLAKLNMTRILKS